MSWEKENRYPHSWQSDMGQRASEAQIARHSRQSKISSACPLKKFNPASSSRFILLPVSV